MARLQEMTMNRGNRALVFLALAAGLVAAVLVFVALSEGDDGKTATVSEGVPVASVVVASQNISPGTEITADMLRVIEVPQELLITGAYTETTSLVGQKARVAILSGEQVPPGKIGAQGDSDGISYVLPPGTRAVAIQVQDLTAVGGLLLPGNRVDIVGAFRIDDAPGVGEDEDLMRVATILQNVEVISVAQEAQEPVPAPSTEDDGTQELPTSGQLPDDVDEQPGASTVTVALDPAQVQALVSAQEVAERVWLTLRPFGEDQPVDLPAYDVIVSE
jgi:pilus assembly protein CpaB